MQKGFKDKIMSSLHNAHEHIYIYMWKKKLMQNGFGISNIANGYQRANCTKHNAHVNQKQILNLNV